MTSVKARRLPIPYDNRIHGVCRLINEPSVKARTIDFEFKESPQPPANDVAPTPSTQFAGQTDPFADLQQDDRGAPIPFGPGAPQTMTVPLIRGPAGDMVNAVTAAREVHLEMATLVALAVASAVWQRQVVVQCADDWTEPLSFYALAAAPSGYGKSPVFASLIKPLQEWEQEQRRVSTLRRQDQVQRRDLEQARLAQLKKEYAKASDAEAQKRLLLEVSTLTGSLTAVEAVPTFIAGDITPERIATLLSENGGRLALLSAEGGAVLGNLAGRYSAQGMSNFDVVLSSYDAEDYSRHRIDAETEATIDRPALSVCWAVQPDLLKSVIAQPALRDRGFLARFVVVSLPRHDSPRSYERILFSDLVAAYGRHLRGQLEASARLPRPTADQAASCLPLDGAAQARLRQWRRDWVDTRLRDDGELAGGVLESWASKLAGRVARIAALMHLLERGYAKSDFVSLETLQRSIEFAEAVLVPQAVYLLGSGGADGQALEVWQSILRQVERGTLQAEQDLTVSELQQPLKRTYPNVRAILPVIETLVEMGYLRWGSPSPTGGANSKHIVIRQAAL